MGGPEVGCRRELFQLLVAIKRLDYTILYVHMLGVRIHEHRNFITNLYAIIFCNVYVQRKSYPIREMTEKFSASGE